MPKQFNFNIGLEGATKPSATDVEAFQGDVSAHRICEIPAPLQFRLDKTSGGSDSTGTIYYQGWAAQGRAESADQWLLYKLWKDTDGDFVKRLVGYDSWNNRTTASYT